VGIEFEYSFNRRLGESESYSGYFREEEITSTLPLPEIRQFLSYAACGLIT
jgi:hypothetical protein